MSSRMKGAGGIGGEDDDLEKPLTDRPYPPGLQPGGELCISSHFALCLPPINYSQLPWGQLVPKSY